MEHVFEVLYECEKLDRIPVDDLGFARSMLSEIGVKEKITDESKKRDADYLDQAYQYWVYNPL